MFQTNPTTRSGFERNTSVKYSADDSSSTTESRPQPVRGHHRNFGSMEANPPSVNRNETDSYGLSCTASVQRDRRHNNELTDSLGHSMEAKPQSRQSMSFSDHAYKESPETFGQFQRHNRITGSMKSNPPSASKTGTGLASQLVQKHVDLNESHSPFEYVYANQQKAQASQVRMVDDSTLRYRNDSFMETIPLSSYKTGRKSHSGTFGISVADTNAYAPSFPGHHRNAGSMEANPQSVNRTGPESRSLQRFF